MAWKPDYATAAQLRAYMRAGDTSEDTTIYTPCITAASRLIDATCGRQFGVTTATARYYTPKWDAKRSRYMASVDDFMSVTSLAIASDMDADAVYEQTIDDFVKLPLNAAANLRPWTDLQLNEFGSANEGSLRVTALWGWTAVPDPILEATLLQASRFATRRSSPYGVAGSPDMGNELRLLSKLDPDVKMMLVPFRRYWA